MINKRNASGVLDPTAYEAELNIAKEKKTEKEARLLRGQLTGFAIRYGFALTSCTLEHFDTRKKFKL